jgi:hypothetical protein
MQLTQHFIEMQVSLDAVSLRAAVSEPSGGCHDAGGGSGGRGVALSLLTAAAAYITASRSSACHLLRVFTTHIPSPVCKADVWQILSNIIAARCDSLTVVPLRVHLATHDAPCRSGPFETRRSKTG